MFGACLAVTLRISCKVAGRFLSMSETLFSCETLIGPGPSAVVIITTTRCRHPRPPPASSQTIIDRQYLVTTCTSN